MPYVETAAQAETRKNTADTFDSYNCGILNSLSAHIAVLDHSGTIISVNNAWEKFARENGGALELVALGSNYFKACLSAGGKDSASKAEQTIEGIQRILSQEIQEFELEYDCHSPDEQRWFLMRVTPMNFMGQKAVVSHINITQEKMAPSCRLTSLKPGLYSSRGI